MIEWYVMRERKAEGPYSDFQLHRLAAEGTITPADLIWFTGRQEFIPACEVHNLFAAMASPADQCLSPTVPPSRLLPAWLADYIQSAAPISSKRREMVWEMQAIVHDNVPYIIPYYAFAIQAYRLDRFTGWQDSETKIALEDTSSLLNIEPIK